MLHTYNRSHVGHTPPPVILSIAGSDSGGGAGIQADLKTVDAHGMHGITAITCVTAQNTRGVHAVHVLPAAAVASQLHALFEDFPVAAVKIGMLGSAGIVRAVAAVLRRYRPAQVVLDPVMVATTGASLSSQAAVRGLLRHLLPFATLVTPNLPATEALTGLRLRRAADFDRAAAVLRVLGARAVLLKGGHARGAEVVDRYYDALGHKSEFRHPRLRVSGHGTGCSLATAVACGLAQGLPAVTAVRQATDFLARALSRAYRPGRGQVSVLGHAAARRR